MVAKSSLLFLYISPMFEIKIIETGFIKADGGAMFGAIPKRAWKRKYIADDENLCSLAMRCILAISEGRKILVDTGMGNKYIDKMSYYQPHGLIDLSESISDLGYSNEQITDVVLTHLHFDHCGYATYINKEGRIMPTFPNAKYWLSRKQWENYQNPNKLESDSILAENIQPIYDAGQLYLIDSDTSLTDSFHLRLFDGHSSGQLVAYIDTTEGVYTFPGDLIPTSAHVSLEWISAYDVCALTSLNEKERFLIEAEEKDYTLIYCHDAVISKSKVKKLNDDFIMKMS